MHQTQFSEKIPYGGFSQIRSHMLNGREMKSVNGAHLVDAVLATQQSILHEFGNRIQNFTPPVPEYFNASSSHFSRSLARN